MNAVRGKVWGLLALLLTLVLPGWAAEAPPLDGLWKGPLKMPGGQLEVIFRLVKLTSGEYFATLDVPMQRVSHLAVQVTTRGDTVILASTEANCRYTGRLLASGGELQGTWQQPGFQAPLALTHSVLAIATAAPSVRLTPPYRETDVTFNNPKASLRLAGTLTVPAGPGPFPAVALLSDVGAQDRNGTEADFAPLGRLADYLTRRGIAVLRFDDRGTGQSTGPNQSQATVAHLVSDAQAALGFLRARPEIDSAHVGLLGHGEGGNVALLAAAQPLPPAFVIGLAPAGLTGSEVILQRQQATLLSLQTTPKQLAAALKYQQSIFDIIRQTVNNSQAQTIVAGMLKQSNVALDDARAQAQAAEMVAPHYRYALTFNPLEKLPKVHCPVLLLFGTADATVNGDVNLEALARGLRADKSVTIRKLPGVNHLFQPDFSQWPIVSGERQPNFSPVAQETMRAWLVAQTQKAAPAPTGTAPAAKAESKGAQASAKSSK